MNSHKEILGLHRITKKHLKELCKKHRLYQTPHLNDQLYLHFQGFQAIENLEEYTGLKCLWLESNAISEIQGLDCQKELKCLFLQNNLIRKIENLESCSELDTLNLASNHITRIENCGIDILPVLSTLNLSRNYIRSSDGLQELVNCKSLWSLDLSHNRIDDILVVKIFANMPELRVLVLQGNPVVNRVPQYRKTLILECKNLTYLDSRPVFPKDRACAEAWKRGGYEEERKEHERWIRMDRRKIRESVNATLRLRIKNGDKEVQLLTSTDEEEEDERRQPKKLKTIQDASADLEITGVECAVDVQTDKPAMEMTGEKDEEKPGDRNSDSSSSSLDVSFSSVGDVTSSQYGSHESLNNREPTRQQVTDEMLVVEKDVNTPADKKDEENVRVLSEEPVEKEDAEQMEAKESSATLIEQLNVGGDVLKEEDSAAQNVAPAVVMKTTSAFQDRPTAYINSGSSSSSESPSESESSSMDKDISDEEGDDEDDSRSEEFEHKRTPMEGDVEMHSEAKEDKSKAENQDTSVSGSIESEGVEEVTEPSTNPDQDYSNSMSFDEVVESQYNSYIETLNEKRSTQALYDAMKANKSATAETMDTSEEEDSGLFNSFQTASSFSEIDNSGLTTLTSETPTKGEEIPSESPSLDDIPVEEVPEEPSINPDEIQIPDSHEVKSWLKTFLTGLKAEQERDPGDTSSVTDSSLEEYGDRDIENSVDKMLSMNQKPDLQSEAAGNQTTDSGAVDDDKSVSEEPVIDSVSEGELWLKSILTAREPRPPSPQPTGKDTSDEARIRQDLGWKPSRAEVNELNLLQTLIEESESEEQETPKKKVECPEWLHKILKSLRDKEDDSESPLSDYKSEGHPAKTKHVETNEVGAAKEKLLSRNDEEAQAGLKETADGLNVLEEQGIPEDNTVPSLINDKREEAHSGLSETQLVSEAVAGPKPTESQELHGDLDLGEEKMGEAQAGLNETEPAAKVVGDLNSAEGISEENTIPTICELKIEESQAGLRKSELESEVVGDGADKPELLEDTAVYRLSGVEVEETKSVPMTTETMFDDEQGLSKDTTFPRLSEDKMEETPAELREVERTTEADGGLVSVDATVSLKDNTIPHIDETQGENCEINSLSEAALIVAPEQELPDDNTVPPLKNDKTEEAQTGLGVAVTEVAGGLLPEDEQALAVPCEDKMIDLQTETRNVCTAREAVAEKGTEMQEDSIPPLFEEEIDQMQAQLTKISPESEFSDEGLVTVRSTNLADEDLICPPCGDQSDGEGKSVPQILAAPEEDHVQESPILLEETEASVKDNDEDSVPPLIESDPEFDSAEKTRNEFVEHAQSIKETDLFPRPSTPPGSNQDESKRFLKDILEEYEGMHGSDIFDKQDEEDKLEKLTEKTETIVDIPSHGEGNEDEKESDTMFEDLERVGDADIVALQKEKSTNEDIELPMGPREIILLREEDRDEPQHAKEQLDDSLIDEDLDITVRPVMDVTRYEDDDNLDTTLANDDTGTGTTDPGQSSGNEAVSVQASDDQVEERQEDGEENTAKEQDEHVEAKKIKNVLIMKEFELIGGSQLEANERIGIDTAGVGEKENSPANDDEELEEVEEVKEGEEFDEAEEEDEDEEVGTADADEKEDIDDDPPSTSDDTNTITGSAPQKTSAEPMSWWERTLAAARSIASSAVTKQPDEFPSKEENDSEETAQTFEEPMQSKELPQQDQAEANDLLNSILAETQQKIDETAFQRDQETLQATSEEASTIKPSDDGDDDDDDSDYVEQPSPALLARTSTLREVLESFNKVVDIINKNRQERLQKIDAFINHPLTKEFSSQTQEELDQQIDQMNRERHERVKQLVDHVYAQRDKYDDTLEVIDGRLMVVKRGTGEVEEVPPPPALKFYSCGMATDSQGEGTQTPCRYVSRGVSTNSAPCTSLSKFSSSGVSATPQEEVASPPSPRYASREVSTNKSSWNDSESDEYGTPLSGNDEEEVEQHHQKDTKIKKINFPQASNEIEFTETITNQRTTYEQDEVSFLKHFSDEREESLQRVMQLHRDIDAEVFTEVSKWMDEGGDIPSAAPTVKKRMGREEIILLKQMMAQKAAEKADAEEAALEDIAWIFEIPDDDD